MIRVTIELFPHGRVDRAKTLGIIDIANDGSGNSNTGNYNFYAWDRGTDKNLPHTRENLKKAKWAGYLEGFPRKRLLAFDLLFRCLRMLFGDRNG